MGGTAWMWTWQWISKPTRWVLTELCSQWLKVWRYILMAPTAGNSESDGKLSWWSLFAYIYGGPTCMYANMYIQNQRVWSALCARCCAECKNQGQFSKLGYTKKKIFFWAGWSWKFSSASWKNVGYFKATRICLWFFRLCESQSCLGSPECGKLHCICITE